jgi:hypothetical protein
VLSFAVHEPPNPPADRVDRATDLVFVKDGFTWPAALFTPLWMLMHRLWWWFIGYLALLALLGALLDRKLVIFGAVASSIVAGLEAAPLRMGSLGRRGWRNLGFVTGKTLSECERRFIEAWLPSQPLVGLDPVRGHSSGAWWWQRWWPLSLRR